MGETIPTAKNRPIHGGLPERYRPGAGGPADCFAKPLSLFLTAVVSEPIPHNHRVLEVTS